MNKHSQQFLFGSTGHIAKSRNLFLVALVLGLSLSACSSSGSKSASSKSSSPQQDRSEAFQRKLQTEQAAEDARDRNSVIQEQTMREEAELRRMRAERAAQRNAQREANANQQDQ